MDRRRKAWRLLAFLATSATVLVLAVAIGGSVIIVRQAGSDIDSHFGDTVALSGVQIDGDGIVLLSYTGPGEHGSFTTYWSVRRWKPTIKTVPILRSLRPSSP